MDKSVQWYNIRLWLSVCGLVVTGALLAFLWSISLNMNSNFQSVLGEFLLFIGICALASQCLFFLKGDIFSEDGKLKKSQILTGSVGILIILQITFMFTSYAFSQIDFSKNAVFNAKSTFVEVQKLLINNSIKDYGAVFSSAAIEQLLADRPELSTVVLLDGSDRIVYSVNSENISQNYPKSKDDYYQFPVKDGSIIIEINHAYNYRVLEKVAIELITVMIVSIFLTVELLLFGIKIIERCAYSPILINGEAPNQALSFVRQIAFLFYFSTGLVSSFIPVMAKNFNGNLLGIQGNTLASIPQSAEIFTTCVAIVFSGILLEKKGWKEPFVLGLFFVVIGSLASAYSVNILMFILARTITGFGYGFCWMTLRNFALFGRSEAEKGMGFSLLNAGLYAGLNCGAVLGGILAERFGFSVTIVVSTIFTVACFLLVVGFSNAKYVKPQVVKCAVVNTVASSWREWLIVVLFVFLIVFPSCIINAFPTFYLPIYLTSLGYTTADIGRMQLLYGLMIVYIGPVVVKEILKSAALLGWNVISNIIFAGALISFGIYGGFYAALFAVAIIGIADSFGFVVQNNYFLRLKPILQIGESKALAHVSLLKKFYQMLGPIVLALFLSANDVSAMATMGLVIIIAAILFGVFAKKYS